MFSFIALRSTSDAVSGISLTEKHNVKLLSYLPEFKGQEMHCGWWRPGGRTQGRDAP